MNRIRDLIRQTRVLDLGPLPAPRLPANATVLQALQMLVRARRGAVVVVEGAVPVGVFSERDVLSEKHGELFASRDKVRQTPLESVMSKPPVTVHRQAMLLEAIENMVGHRRHLVVVDRNGELKGLLTTNDLVQFLTDQFPEDTVNLPPRLRQQFQRPEGA